MNADDLHDVSAKLGASVTALTAQPGRTRTQVFRAAAEHGDLGLKHYPSERTVAELRFEVHLAQTLHARSVAVPRYLAPAPDGFVRLRDGTAVLAYEWVAGHCPPRITPELASKAARLLRDFHAASNAVAEEVPDGNWLWDDALALSFRRDIPASLTGFVTAVAEAGQPWGATERLIPCHNDLVAQNLVESARGRLVAIDLTNVMLAPPAWDLAVLCAGILLESDASARSPRRTIELILESYIPGVVDGDAVNELLHTALVQRAVFLTYSTGDLVSAPIWRRLEAVLTILGRWHRYAS